MLEQRDREKGGRKKKQRENACVPQQNSNTVSSLKQTPLWSFYLFIWFFTENSLSVSVFDLLTWKTSSFIDIHKHTPS